MEASEIHLSDWGRILSGQVPGSFYIEALIRTVAVYLILLLSMRLMGKRMTAQLGRNELATMVALAAAIGVPILAPDRGILPAVIIAVVIVGISKGLAALTNGRPKLQEIVQGNYGCLVVDGVLQLKTMAEVRISQQGVFSHLREQSIRHLGEVQRLYLEASGEYTLIKKEQPQPGLSVIPDWDTEFLRRQHRSDVKVCRRCGAQKGPTDVCAICKCNAWEAGLD